MNYCPFKSGPGPVQSTCHQVAFCLLEEVSILGVCAHHLFDELLLSPVNLHNDSQTFLVVWSLDDP